MKDLPVVLDLWPVPNLELTTFYFQPGADLFVEPGLYVPGPGVVKRSVLSNLPKFIKIYTFDVFPEGKSRYMCEIHLFIL